MGQPARFDIMSRESSPERLVIRDLGPWTVHFTVTNDAEGVVERLVAAGELPPGRRLFCYDSDGALDELEVVNGQFAGFRPGPYRKAHQGPLEPDQLEVNNALDPYEFTESPQGHRARERWARRYDELNGAPEGDWDR